MHTLHRSAARASFTGLALTVLLGVVGALPAGAATGLGAVVEPGADGTAEIAAAETAPAETAAAEIAVPTASSSGVALDSQATDITFTGHGWGHGRGMGQYGALGYAVDHGWSYSQILAHFYGGTSVGNVGNPPISVELTALNDKPLVVTGTSLTINGVPVPAGVQGLVARTKADGSILIRSTGVCYGEIADIGTYPAGVRISTTNQTTLDGLVKVCEASGQRAYRGDLSVQKHAKTGVQTTFNHLPLEEYLRGVVPRESPDGWGTAGGGKGMQALKAQAVAARSYAIAGGVLASGAKTCDTTSCQVYGGAGFWPSATPRLDGDNANVAIDTTAGEVRVMNGTGAVARTEFSSSTGGYTVAGTFPAVVDLGDAYAGNPNHTWVATFTIDEVAATLGIPGVRSITVTGRNGLGDWGGRVTSVLVVDGNGTSHAYSGGEFRSALGTSRFKSDWFTFSWSSQAASEAVVRALYQDLLGRAPDPTGLAGWTTTLMQGQSQSALVDTLTRSDEYISSRVTKAYREVLGREPEPAGAAAWLSEIKAGHATVDDVQRRFYDSVEYYATSGGTPEGYVRRLYQTVLSRPAGDAEVAEWSAVFATRGRGVVVDAIWFSNEAARIRAGAYYQTFLGRGPDPVGLAGWADVLLRQGEGAVRVGIAGSLEYRARAIARFP
ncbi:DUF4214 domain-containing protein [Cellulomonas sp. KRMCY2]|uniref:DUF4214 domain-containing protein n=1 Tax=Cellulomonas sp. KRMCY2 TaxID=1304865 RepID=UPI0004B9D799|nr:DUF4214 domain-containing protein [Cellulomonas sp. KRMCY2]